MATTRKKTKKEKEAETSPFLENPVYVKNHPFSVFVNKLPEHEQPKFYYNNKGWLVCQINIYGGNGDRDREG